MTDISHWLKTHAAFDPEKVALRHAGGEETYAQFADQVRCHAAMLQHGLGIGRGDRIAYLGPNTADFLFLFFAAARLGAMFLPLNWRLAPGEHAYIIADASPKAVFCDASFIEHTDTFRGRYPTIAFVDCNGGTDGWNSLRGLLDDTSGQDVPRLGDLADPLLLVYTSGTTGRPKGAVLTQNAVQVNALNSLHMHDLRSDDRILTMIPLFHVGGLNIHTTPAFYAGATVTLHERFDPGMALKTIEEEKITLTVMVPAVIQAAMKHPKWDAANLSSLRMLTTGSSIVPLPLIQAFHDLGVPVVQVYGATETAPVAIYQRAADGFRKPSSTGKAALHCDVRVVDDNGHDVAPGVSGEIWVRGGNILREYWNNPDATAAALTDGWFHTGDVGYQDEEGDYFINDRKKDVIISGGENIYPAEVEAVLHEMTEIADAAVVGRADDRWGEVPIAVVEAKEGAQIDVAAILGRFDGVLARFKHPKDIIVVDALPRNAMGKVLKYEVRGLAVKSPDYAGQ